eukprot:Gb_00138 [translate_table: standard]
MGVYAYTSLIIACTRNGKNKDAIIPFKKIEEEGCEPIIITYNIMLDVYRKMGNCWNKVLSLFAQMKNRGINPDEYTYNTPISACRRGSMHEEAVEFFKKMKAAGCTPDRVTYNSPLDVYGNSRRHDDALNILQGMEKNGCPPSIVTYNELIAAYSRDGLYNQTVALKDTMAMKVLMKIQKEGCSPNICTFNALINMYGKKGKIEEMMRICTGESRSKE